MPTYHARKITVRLGSVPLAETITRDVVLRKGEVAKRQSDMAYKKLLHSFYLKETRVLFPGDPEGFGLNWLGGAPFMQVEADSGFALPSRLTSSPLHDRMGQALALHIELSDKAFHSGLTEKAHLKIEVLFNGQLSACSLIHTNDIRSGAKSLHQVFAGYRADFLAERPWVLLPPHTTVDGGTRRFHKTITPLERFSEISAALLKEAEERGTDEHGNPPPSAIFLDALAKMQAPASVMHMQKPGGRKFGVVDVVITTGTGNKLTTGTNYLKRPERLKDPNYIVRNNVESRITSKTETVAAEAVDTHNRMGKSTQEPSSGLDFEHAGREREMGVQEELLCESQALSLVEDLLQRATHGAEFQNVSLGLQAPFLPLSNRYTSQTDVSTTAGRFSSSCSSLEYHRDGHEEPLPSNGRNHTCAAVFEQPQMQGCNNTASRIVQDYHYTPTDVCSLNPQPVQMPSASTSRPPFIVSMIEQGIFDSSPLPDSDSNCSPKEKTRNECSPHFPQLVWSDGTDTMTPTLSHFTPTAWMLPTTTSWQASPDSIASLHCHPTYFPQQAQPNFHPLDSASCKPPNGLPNLFPQKTLFFGYHDSVPDATQNLSSSPVLQACGPLPPTALFSVPSKPRRSASSTKDMAMTNPAEPRIILPINRLVITGLGGRQVVDHHWKVTQYIVADHRRPGMETGKGQMDKFGSECEEPNARSRAQLRSKSRNRSPHTKCRASPPIRRKKIDTVQQSMRLQWRDRFWDGQVVQKTRSLLPYPKRNSNCLKDCLSANSQIDVRDSVAPFASALMQNMGTQAQTPSSRHIAPSVLPIEPVTSQYLAFPRHEIPGIQGPKAATFLLDDPEEVLREAVKPRRFRSPTKPVASSRMSAATLPAQIDTITVRSGPGGSSPLSSVPSSPLPGIVAEVTETASMPHNRILQLDGLSERIWPTATPRQSSPKTSNPSQPELQCPRPATPQSSVLEVSKRRKCSHHWPANLPRSHNRLNTVSNPPLNDDCVIAFAQSANKDGEKAILRQIKGERQGVFKEQHVVLAVRFFVAGG